MIKRIENWLFYIFLFAVPISLRHIFGYQPFEYVEWTATYIYATDILLGILLTFWAVRLVDRNRTGSRGILAGDSARSPEGANRRGIGPAAAGSRWTRAAKSVRWSDVFLLAFVAVAGISIGNAINPAAAWFAWLKLIEGVLLYFYVKDYALKRFDMTAGFTAIVLGGLFQSVIAIPQFIIQSSLGLKWLGESVLSPSQTGIAAFLVNGLKVMRAYGTTPHSNVLAAYLFVALGAFYNISIYHKRRWWWYVFHAITLWAFLLTFSRVIIGIWILNFIARAILIRWYPKFHAEFWENKEMRRRSMKIFWTTLAVGAVFTAVYWPYAINRSTISTADEAVQMRVFYNHESLVSGHNLFGLGMGNFVPWLMTQNLHLSRDLYQPAHNIYLLIYSETGIVGIGLFLIFLALLLYDFYRRLGFKKLYHSSFGLIIVSVLLFGLFDHFLWTIQAGRLILWPVLALLAGAD